MRIAHVTDCYLPRLGGIELQVHDLARRQHEIGHDVTVVTSVAADAAADPPGVVVHRPGKSRDAGGAIRYVRSLSGRRAVLAARYDVVHVHASTFSPLGFLTAQATSRAGIPTAVTLHSLWSYAAPLFRIANRVSGWADWPIAWSAVSTVAAQPLHRVLRGRASVAVVPNGVDPSQWSRPRDAKSLADRSAVAGVRLIAVMRLAPRKRPRELLAMLRHVARMVDPSVGLSVDIIGDGPQRPMLERYLRRHDMTGWVSLRGRASRAEIGAALSLADVFIAPATLESFGIAALEARSAGLPVVARAGTGVEDFITHGREGLLVASDAEMVEAMVDLITSPELRARLTAHNNATPPAVTWDDVLARCDALYEAAFARQDTGARRLIDRATTGVLPQ